MSAKTATLPLIGWLLASLLATATSQALPLESVHSGVTQNGLDFQYVRGMNYLAVYPGLHDANGPFTFGQPVSPGGPAYHGIGNSTMMWLYYGHTTNTGSQTTTAHIDEQLRWLKKSGFNTVRVWVSFPYWQYCRLSSDLNATQGPAPRTGMSNLHVARFADFVARCTQNGLKVMPVLWDSVYAGGGGSPTYGTAPTYAANLSQANRHGWHSNPGEAEIPNRLVPNATVPTLNPEAIDYVREFMDTFSNYHNTFLVWDVMNEPHFRDTAGQSTHALELIQATFDAIDQHPDLPQDLKLKLFSAGVSTAYPETITLALDSRCNVLGLHPFGQTRAPMESLLFDATHIGPLAQNAPPNLLKPMICTEMGSPGLAMSYQEAADYARSLDRYDLVAQNAPAGTKGIGMMSWQAMVPTPNQYDVVPFKFVSGIFYGARSAASGKIVVREINTLTRCVDFARTQLVQQSVNPTWLWTDQELGSLFDEDSAVTFAERCQCQVDTDLDEYAGLLSQVAFVQSHWQTMTWEDCIRTSRAFSPVTGFLDVAAQASTNNYNRYWIPGNPTLPTSPPWSITASDKQNLAAAAAYLDPPWTYLWGQPQYVFRFGGTTDPAWFFYLQFVAGVTGRPLANLQVWNAATVEGQFHRQRLLDWANILQPYLVGRGGP